MGESKLRLTVLSRHLVQEGIGELVSGLQKSLNFLLMTSVDEIRLVGREIGVHYTKTPAHTTRETLVGGSDAFKHLEESDDEMLHDDDLDGDIIELDEHGEDLVKTNGKSQDVPKPSLSDDDEIQQDGSVLRCDYVVCAVPLGILKVCGCLA